MAPRRRAGGAGPMRAPGKHRARDECARVIVGAGADGGPVSVKRKKPKSAAATRIAAAAA